MEKNKKKLILFMPSIDGGGVEKNIFILSNYFSLYLKNISLITFDKKFSKNFNNNIEFISVVKKVNLRISKYIKYATCLLLLIYQIIINNRKIIIFSFQANIYCIIISKIFNVPVISRSNSSPSGWSKNFIKSYIFKKILKLSDEIIVNSKDFKRELDKNFNLNSTVIFNPLNKVEILEKSKSKINLKFFKKKNLKIINIARFTDQKDHLTLLKAFLTVSKKINTQLLIIGYGKNKDKILKFISSNKLEKKVKVLGFTNNPYKYINNSDIFVLTSKFEGLPNVLLESLVLKKFIISTNCPTGPREILDNGKYGFLIPMSNHKILSQKILYFNKNKKKLNKKIYAGYKSLDKYSFNKNCNRYLGVIKKFL
jgi:glycosyltransferase involved in cell wall biosynthesis